jgi:hypothetical protein
MLCNMVAIFQISVTCRSNGIIIWININKLRSFSVVINVASFLNIVIYYIYNSVVCQKSGSKIAICIIWYIFIYFQFTAFVTLIRYVSQQIKISIFRIQLYRHLHYAVILNFNINIYLSKYVFYAWCSVIYNYLLL